MYKCDFPRCKKKCKTVQGLLAHKRLKHGITGAAVYAEIAPTIEEPININVQPVQPQEESENPYMRRLAREMAALEEEREGLLRKIAALYDNRERERLDIEVQPPEEYHFRLEKEKRELQPAFPPLPHPPPLPEPPFSDTLKSKIKMLNDRELFR